MGQAKQRGTFEQRQADALIKLASERARLHDERVAHVALERQRKMDEQERIAALPPEQRKQMTRRPVNMVNMLIALATAGALIKDDA
jgi:hypothetical protein